MKKLLHNQIEAVASGKYWSERVLLAAKTVASTTEERVAVISFLRGNENLACTRILNMMVIRLAPLKLAGV